MVLQYISMQYFNYEWPLLLAFSIYSVWWIVFAKMLSIHLGSLVSKYGYLDGGASRDHIPDTETSWTGVRADLPHYSLTATLSEVFLINYTSVLV